MATTDPLAHTTATAPDGATPQPPFAALSPASSIPRPEPDRGAPADTAALPQLSDAELERQALQHPGGDGDPLTPE